MPHLNCRGVKIQPGNGKKKTTNEAIVTNNSEPVTVLIYVSVSITQAVLEKIHQCKLIN